MDEVSRKAQARQIVFQYVTLKHFLTGFTMDDVYTVAFMRVLQNWRAIISTTLEDSMYYEVTYDGDKGEAVLNVYQKFDSVPVRTDLDWVRSRET